MSADNYIEVVEKEKGKLYVGYMQFASDERAAEHQDLEEFRCTTLEEAMDKASQIWTAYGITYVPYEELNHKETVNSQDREWYSAESSAQDHVYGKDYYGDPECSVCHQWGEGFTTECPKVDMREVVEDLISKHRLDYVSGGWVFKL
ncbi:hypothetical protein HYS94_01980 [Candidatus Daviesbacteria bacterium]|nr:hypothetical protein [Candidatus Daviesbacteria bacterium]